MIVCVQQQVAGCITRTHPGRKMRISLFIITLIVTIHAGHPHSSCFRNVPDLLKSGVIFQR
jgi:hypothetical protein